MRTVSLMMVALLLASVSASRAVAADQSPAAQPADAEPAGVPTDELHFETVLTTHGEIVSVDRTSRLVTIKGPNGHTFSLEARNEKNLDAISTGDRVVVRYIEGIQIRKKKPGEVLPVATLKEGIAANLPGERRGTEFSRKRTLVASVEAIDEPEQEVTLRGPGGGLETVMVENPEALEGIAVGDQIVITHSQALALTLDKES